MEIDGEQRIAAARKDVWTALNDLQTLRLCIPGCDSLERISESEFDGTATAKAGPVKTAFGEGKWTAGFAMGEASVRLREDGGETVLSYTAKPQVGGNLAQVDARLIDSTVRKLSGHFFANRGEYLAAGEVVLAAPTSGVPAAMFGGLSPKAWTVGLIIFAALLVLIFWATGSVTASP